MLDTLHVHDLLVSEEIAAELQSNPAITILPEEVPLFHGESFEPFPPPEG
jgi:hypothetical protein